MPVEFKQEEKDGALFTCSQAYKDTAKTIFIVYKIHLAKGNLNKCLQIRKIVSIV